MTDANIDGLSFWRASKIRKKILSLLISPLSICAEYEISSKLKHLLFFVQNRGLKDGRCQHWQVSRITKNFCHQWIQDLQIVHYAKFHGKWLTSFPIPLFKDSHFNYVIIYKPLSHNHLIFWCFYKYSLSMTHYHAVVF